MVHKVLGLTLAVVGGYKEVEDPAHPCPGERSSPTRGEQALHSPLLERNIRFIQLLRQFLGSFPELLEFFPEAFAVPGS